MMEYGRGSRVTQGPVHLGTITLGACVIRLPRALQLQSRCFHPPTQSTNPCSLRLLVWNVTVQGPITTGWEWNFGAHKEPQK